MYKPPRTIEIDPVEREINKFVDSFNNENLSHQQAQAHLNYIGNMAQVQQAAKEKLAAYEAKVQKMTAEELLTEPHLSERLKRHLVAIGEFQPSGNVDAHAIVPGSHKEGTQLRALMAALGLGIDGSYNGMWMPSRTADTPHASFPACPPHSRIHRFYYYEWIRGRLNSIKNPDVFKVQLKLIKRLLHEGKQPDWVMLAKGAKR